MTFLSVRCLVPILILSSGLVFVVSAGQHRVSGEDFKHGSGTKITVDYPLDGSVFPPEITPPTFLWRDASSVAKRWVIEITFVDRGAAIRVDAPGDPFPKGEIDPQTGSGEDVLTAEHASIRTWRPDEVTWSKIKLRSARPAAVKIFGFAAADSKVPVSQGAVTISTSLDPVGAPVFYRDVPLMLSPRTEDGVIQPLPPSAIPLIKWRLRNLAEPQSRTVMEKLYTCANCHSFSRDGKTLGIDVDGPKNDKGLYAIAPVSKDMAIRNQDVIRWSSFQENLNTQSSEPAVRRFGFMSQISPDGRYVVTSIGPPGTANKHGKENPGFAPGLSDRLFSTNYMDVAFNQVFYPMRGILAWYDRDAKKLRPLPGADDPKFVQTSAFWSPDGKYLIFSRAEARDPYPAGAEKPEHANDPREPQIQYDLYRIPFNGGKGGQAEPVRGASRNGMSNNFPKVSPDGRWIVFVQNHNGLLMRPDSHLYIVPSAGGKPRLMNCNLSLMNSWHTFSPNSRWLAFSSKSRGPYTRLMLTHLDANGNDTPAILVDNTTAANRAVNIPEFVNIPSDGLESIDPQAMEVYKISNHAFVSMEKNEMPEAIEQWRKALQLDPADALAHFSLAVALTGSDREPEALEEYRKACTLEPNHAGWFAHLAVSLALTGDPDGAVANWKKSLALNPSNAEAEMNMGTVLVDRGQIEEGLEHLSKSVEMAPEIPDPHNALGWSLAKAGRTDSAVQELQKAIALRPASVEFHSNLAYVLGMRGESEAAIAELQKAVELSDSKDWQCLAALAAAYNKIGHSGAAIQSARQALDLAVQSGDVRLQKRLRDDLDRYQRELMPSRPQ